ncbi:10697_t:CDS:2 [Ambispora gerdemannii]|uniref:Vacuolar calcium ion transporter n=1 Tax=Ambispora gerdemannii TaxID=144530 RepID=A0A9N9FG82_9GLOM|nr:10697_t:CDS:2 [Ambispora gerdemannii]
MDTAIVVNAHTPLPSAGFNTDYGTRGPSHRAGLTASQSIVHVIKASWINILLVFVPLGIISHHLHWGETLTFSLNFLAIIPLAKILGLATEEIALRVGQTIGSLLNATFGNAIELIISIFAIRQGQIRVVQASMLGSIITSLLLVLGTCFVAGGYYKAEQSFNQTAAQTSSSLMTLACIALIIPAALHAAVDADNHKEILDLSHGTAIVLLGVYGFYLYFQLISHKHLYSEIPEEGEEQQEEQEEKEEPQLTLQLSLGLLVGATLVVAFCAEYLVDSIEGIVESSGLSRTFVGLILLPIVSNAAEYITAVTAAIKDKMDLAIGCTTGSSMQIALLITPFLVVLGWTLDQPMTLFFDVFETVILFISVLITNYLIQDGKSNWLEGVLLLSTYIIIVLAFYFYPEEDTSL